MNWRATLLAVATVLAAVRGATPADSSDQERRSAPATQVAIVITNVTIVDVASGARQPAMTVVTKEDRIADIGARIRVPQGAVRVDGTGKFLVPGLWDMHAHHEATGAESVDLFLANGVVGTRDMGADADFILPLRDRIARGELPGPEIVAAGPILDDRPLDWPFRRHITNAREALDAMRDLKRRGVDFIKVHDATPRDAYFALIEEAPKLGLSVAGHVPLNVTIDEAADSGLRSIEHLANFRVFRDCSGNESYSAARCRPRFDKLAKKGVWQTPTLAFFHALPDVFSGRPMPHAEYASDPLLAATRGNVRASNLNERALSWLRSMRQPSLAAIHDLHASGSGVLAGCDGAVPGFCLHDELQTMTDAGLSPLEAIQTATINPARFLGREKTQGTIEAGKRADLVLLDADPLADIRNVRRVAAVLVRGRLLSKTDIDRMIAARRRPAPPASPKRQSREGRPR